jgi:hypothetical protein
MDPNESLRLGMFQNGEASQRFVEFTDQPDWSIVDMIEETEELEPVAAQAVVDRYVGEGRDRLRFIVPADGDPVAEVVDTEGNTSSLL